MRIALISDSHFDRSSRWDEGLRVHRWIAEDIASRDVDAILLGGDLFERRPIPEETAAAAEWVRSLAAIAEVVGVYGNHDVPQSLEVFNHLRARHRITFYDRPAVHALDGGAIACLPWPRKSTLLAALGHPVSHEESGYAATAALRAVLLGLGAGLDGHRGERLFLGHCMMRGSRVSTGQPIAPGSDFELGTEDLALVRAVAYLLGHVHLGQGFDVNGAPALFPGSPRRTAYGEIENKQYAVITIGGGRLQIEDVATPCAPMLLVEAEFAAEHIGLPGDVVVPAGLVLMTDVADVIGAEIRVRYHVESDKRDAAKRAAEEFRAELLARGAVVVKLEEEVNATTRARAPEIARAVTLEDKLRAYWHARSIDVSDDRAARLFGRLMTIESEAA